MQELETKQEIKVFILYLMDYIGIPLELSEINDMARQDEFVRGIDFIECFMELIDTGNIKIEKKEDGSEPKYQITEQGSKVVAAMKDSLSGYVRSRSVKSAMRYLSFVKRNADMSCTITNNGDKATLKGSITENGDEVFSFSFALENDYQLQLMKHNFEDDPDRVYKAFMAILTGDSGYLGI